MLNKSIYEIEFVVLDLETTGISPEKGAKIVEIAAIKIQRGLKLDAKNMFHTLINPQAEIPYSAYRVHKISNDMVKNAPTIEKVLPEFLNFINTPFLIGQNIEFDFSFISYYSSLHNLKMGDIFKIDTIKIAKKIAPNLKRYNLDSLIDYFGIENILEIDHRHRATFDVYATAIIFLKIIEILERYNPDLRVMDIL